VQYRRAALSSSTASPRGVEAAGVGQLEQMASSRAEQMARDFSDAKIADILVNLVICPLSFDGRPRAVQRLSRATEQLALDQAALSSSTAVGQLEQMASSSSSSRAEQTICNLIRHPGEPHCPLRLTGGSTHAVQRLSRATVQ
jgi:hypothetical protein